MTLVRSGLGALVAFGLLLAASAAVAQPVPAPPLTGCDARTPREQALQGWRAQTQGQWVVAEACIQAASATDDDWTRRHQHELTYSLGIIEEHVGGLQVTGGVPGAQVLLDGVSVATLPMPTPIRVIAGQIRVRISADGYYPVERTVTVAPGDIPSVETATMGPMPPPTPPVVAPVVATPIPLVPLPTLVAAPMAPRSANLLRPLAWAAVVGGVVGVGFGIAGTYLTETGADHYAQICTGQVPASTVPMCPGLRATAVSNQHLGVELETAGYVTAGLLVAATVALFVAAASRDAHRANVAFRCGAGPGTVGIQCGLNFP